MEETLRKAVSAVIVAALLAGFSGCCEEHRSDNGKPLRLHPIYNSAITGAIVGGIIGHQSEEEGEGAALGAVIFGVGALLGEIDRANKEDECEDEDDDEDEEEVVFQIRNDNGSEKAVVLKKKGSTYIGPKGEHYDRLPAAEQLKQIYGS
ncbi:MAG: hypothetical protein JSW47_13445 [Phycisphaerales bacterium]|nr:MAG: hypothetical protein JSW47_13445 [Phycisphaerales bacterium]